MMTERHEITTILQRELVNDPDVFGTVIPADPDHPGVFMESTHHILKTVAGAPNPRPPFFFDILDQGEGLTDVGTHLVDLVQWTLFPDQALDYRQDIQVQGGKRWATPITAAQFRQITGAAAFPAELAPYVHGDQFDYYCNNQVDYKIRGAQVRLKVLWNWESPAGVDFHHAIYRGTRASVEVRQTVQEKYQPELFVAPNGAERHAAVETAVCARIDRLQATYPGIGCETAGDEIAHYHSGSLPCGPRSALCASGGGVPEVSEIAEIHARVGAAQYAGEIFRHHHGRATIFTAEPLRRSEKQVSGIG